MSWLRRFLRRGPEPDEASDGPAVVASGASPATAAVADDLVSWLTADGSSLADAVDRSLRRLRAMDEQAAMPADAIPFWLRRGSDPAEIESVLRDRVMQRREAES